LQNQEYVIQNDRGVRCEIFRTADGYALGSISFFDCLLEAPLKAGLIRLRNRLTGDDQWFCAETVQQVSQTNLEFSGSGQIEGIDFSFKLDLETPADTQAIRLTYEFVLQSDLKEYDFCLQYYTDTKYRWKAHLYPWVEDSKWVERDRLDNMGIPALLLYREDRALGVLWGIDPNSDYLNPTSWRRDFGLYFIDGLQPAQYRVGAGNLKKGIHYECPMQIVLTSQRDPDGMIIELLEQWRRLNQYSVKSLKVRSHDEALQIFIQGRREKTDAWIPEKGYSLHGAKHTFLYFGVQGMAAYFDYLLYEMTGDSLWRQRSFEQMDFIAQGQNRDIDDFNYGAIHTTYQLEWLDDYGAHGPGFNSDDRFNIGYKPDICALLVRYMLQLWQRVKDHEGVDHQDWYQTAILAANWIIRQQNPDGGLPQKVQMKPLEMRWGDENNRIVIQPFKSRSSASGRALPSLWQIGRITADQKYKDFLTSLEEFTLRNVQNCYHYTGHHPDLPPYEFEEASIWGVAEYWLNRYDETGNSLYLKHAEADAALALLWWCPKELSWVKNPTQCASAEQQHFQQYSVYNYQNRKVEGLWRLYSNTGDQIYLKLFERVLQNIYFTQETQGGNMGGTYERIADPWLVRKETPGGPYFDSLGVNYTNEQALDCFLQTLELFRTGTRIYLDPELVHKIYPDGICFYSKNISHLTPVNLEMRPSMGTLNVTVEQWSDDKKILWISTIDNEQFTLSYRIWGLKASRWYQVKQNHENFGIFQADLKGEILFASSSRYESKIRLKLEII
jgi:hypothetical protein